MIIHHRYASPVPVQNKTPGSTGQDGKDPQLWAMGGPPPTEWPTMYGYEPISDQDPRKEVQAAKNYVLGQSMGGRLSIDRACQSQMLYALDDDDLFVLCHYRGSVGPTSEEIEEIQRKEAAAAAAAKKEEEEKEEGGDEGEKEDAEETPAIKTPERPKGPPLQFHRYSCGDLLCELYPAIAACCPDGMSLAIRNERQNNAKRLFVMATPEQRRNPNANLGSLLLGPQDMHPPPPTGSTVMGGILPPTASSSHVGVGSQHRGGSGLRAAESQGLSRAASTRKGGSRVGGRSTAQHSAMGMSSASRMASAHGSISTLGSAAPGGSTVSTSLMAKGGVPSITRGAVYRSKAGMFAGVRTSQGSAAVARSFAAMREGKRERDTAKYKKRHQELREMSTKPK